MKIISVAEATENGIDLSELVKYFVNHDCEEFAAIFETEIEDNGLDEEYTLYRILKEEDCVISLLDFIELGIYDTRKEIINIDSSFWDEFISEVVEGNTFTLIEDAIVSDKNLIRTTHNQLREIMSDVVVLKMNNLQKCISASIKFL